MPQGLSSLGLQTLQTGGKTFPDENVLLGHQQIAGPGVEGSHKGLGVVSMPPLPSRKPLGGDDDIAYVPQHKRDGVLGVIRRQAVQGYLWDGGPGRWAGSRGACATWGWLEGRCGHQKQGSIKGLMNDTEWPWAPEATFGRALLFRPGAGTYGVYPPFTLQELMVVHLRPAQDGIVGPLEAHSSSLRGGTIIQIGGSGACEGRSYRVLRRVWLVPALQRADGFAR